MNQPTAVITGTGSFVPNLIQKNDDFFAHTFYQTDGTPIKAPNEIIVKKFKQITGIEERRYLESNLDTTDMALEASKIAIQDAQIDPETLDYIIFAHNFGNAKADNDQADQLPALASRLKHFLKIKNPNCVAYDIIFGCPGWVEAIIQGYAFIRSGMAKKVLVVGSETLSRVVDKHDRDSMIYADGAGASIIEVSEEPNQGILSYASQSFTFDEAFYLFMGESYNLDDKSGTEYMKMHGRKIYEFALTNVPLAIKDCLEKSGTPIDDVKKILIHQANEKMDEAIIKRLYKLYEKDMPEGIMPMSIHKLGNSSVATVPTLLDLIKRDQIEGHELNKGDVIILASVGAGMNVNAITYRM